ncbi:hypothetical protein LTR50_004447 [Elasticomyces elasticus]|nr:hypothetical protein LTR50_004447 [Elasticomyces elasticus]
MLSKTMRGSAVAALVFGLETSAYMGASLNTPMKRQNFPANATDVTTIISPTNVTIRYKQPGTAGVCETTPGVNSYSGYIDLAPNMSTFFWFFESRSNPATDQITLWLNGGPGSDSLIGLFQELGPCNVTANLTSMVNPYSWNEASNLLFLSQPYGVGFSNEGEELGSFNYYTGSLQNASVAPPAGRYPVVDATILDTTDLAAVAAWHILQGFFSALPQLDAKVGGQKEFNLWTESYGGHYGPSFFNYFYDHNSMIANGTESGTYLNLNTLGIGNGIIDEYIQAPYYPEFANFNTYGIKAVNDTVYNYMKFACYMSNGCLDQIAYCRNATVNGTSASQRALCSEAQAMCRDNVEGPYYYYGGRGVYDIRHPFKDPTPPPYFLDYLNQGYVQNALGVDLNYTQANTEVYYAFQATGDFVYGNFKRDLEMLLSHGVRVNLYYGDADYICNWFGGEAVSLAINYTHSAEFAAAGYEPFVVDGVEYGAVRQYGNFSFTRVYESGHLVPYYQPLAALALFNRTLNHFDIATGLDPVTANLTTGGLANSTHTEPYVALPSSTTRSASATSGATSTTQTGAPVLPIKFAS